MSTAIYKNGRFASDLPDISSAKASTLLLTLILQCL